MNYTDFKAICLAKSLRMQYVDSGRGAYFLTAWDGPIEYTCKLIQDSGEDHDDFEANVKSTCNQREEIRSSTYRPEVMTSSRPTGVRSSQYWTGRGDGASTIGDGNGLFYDFSNNTNDITAPSGYKRKRIEIDFVDDVWFFEGRFKWMGAVKGSYVDFHIVCPSGSYYYTNNGTPTLASEDTIVETFLNHHYFFGDNPAGEVFSAEAAQDLPMPSNYKAWCEITVPDSDSSSYGASTLVLYRTRSRIL